MDRMKSARNDLAAAVAASLTLRHGAAARIADRLITAYAAINPTFEIDPEHLTSDERDDLLAGLDAITAEPRLDDLAAWIGHHPWADLLMLELRDPHRTFDIDAQIEALFLATPPDVTQLPTVARCLLSVFVAAFPSRDPRTDVNGKGMAGILAAAAALRPAW